MLEFLYNCITNAEYYSNIGYALGFWITILILSLGAVTSVALIGEAINYVRKLKR